ncbi:MAG TPA: hypothetical protein DCQ83_05800, partial [Fibrobacteres bacterium]|nr:hypothetical protein [Fibrobacterota bacterium]
MGAEMKKKLGFLAVVLAMAVFAVADDYSQWLNYKDITINTSAAGANVTGDVARYPLLVRLDSNSFTDFAVSGTKASIRFARGSVHLPYQVERWDSAGGNVAEIWVLVDSVYGNNSSQSIRMYWSSVGAGDSSSSSGVFNTSNNFQAVWHMNGATATSNELDATNNNFTATYFQSAGSTTPLSTGGIGYSRVVTPASASTGPYFMAGVLPLNPGSATARNARAIKFPSSSVGYAVGDGGSIVKTADGGAHWTAQSSGVTDTLFGLFCTDVSTCVVVGSNGRLITTTDGGSNWSTPAGAGGNGSGAGITPRWNDVSLIGDLSNGTLYIVGMGSKGDAVAGNDTTNIRKATITAGSWSWRADSSGSTRNMYGITCLDASNCVVIGGTTGAGLGRIEVTTTGGGPTGHGWTNTSPATIGGPYNSISWATGNLTSGAAYIATGGTTSTTNLIKVTFASATPTVVAQTSNLAVILKSVFCSDSTHCIAVGNSVGTAPAITTKSAAGAAWTAYSTSPTGSASAAYPSLNSIYCTSTTTTCYAAGNNGFILNKNGSTWGAGGGLDLLSGAGNGYTLSSWVKWLGATGADGSGHQAIISKNDYQYYLKVYGTNAATWAAGEYTNGGWREPSSTTTPAGNGSWHYAVSVKRKGSSDTLGLYVDGVKLKDSVYTSTSAQDSTYPLTIGRQANSAVRFWNGNIDEVVVSNTSRSSDWIKLSYETQKAGATAVTIGPLQNSGPPVGLTYTTNPAVYAGGTAITANAPHFTSGGAGTWTVSPALPAGLTLNASTGVISGTPTSATSAANYLVTASNNLGTDTETVNITVNAVAPSSLTYATTAYLMGVNRADSSSTPTVNAGGLTVTYTSDPLPAGLSLNSSTGRITGTPTVGAATANYTVTATNAQGSTNTSLTITVLNPISTFTYDTHTLTLGKNVAMTADNATATGTSPFGPVKFYVSPTLPAGLALDSLTGVVSGTPTTAQSSTKYTLTAKNGIAAFNLVDSLFIAIPNAPTALTYSSNTPTYEEGQAIPTNSPSLTATVPFTPVTYAVTAGSLPSGLTLNADGTITGTLSAGTSSGSPYSISITVTNASGSAKDSTMVITVLGTENYSGWTYNKSMTLNTSSSGANVTTSQTNFPVLVRLTSKHLTVFQQAASGGTDIRFTDSSGTHLPYQIERWSFVPGDTSAAIWVAANSVAASGTTTIKMYWGNGSATSRSNGSAVFSSGYVSVWHMGDTTATDPRPNAISGGLTATPRLFSTWGYNPGVTGMIGGGDSLVGGQEGTFANGALTT